MRSGVVPGRFYCVDIMQGNAIDPFRCQYSLRGMRPFDGRHPKATIISNVFRHFGDRRRFKPQIHFKRH